MAANTDQHVLYQSDFVGRTTKLSPAAAERIDRLNAAGSLNSQTLKIQPSYNADLDQVRLAAVTSKLYESGITDARVEIAVPPALGLSGVLAENSLVGGGQSQGNGSRSGAQGTGLSGGNF
ncbi:hypothetical protein [Planctomycetes bacterium K23_9]